MRGSDDYSKITEMEREEIHFNAQKFLIVLIGLSEARRGREGFADLKKSDFKVFEDPDVGKYVKQVVSSSSKNHKEDSQDMRKGGILVCTKNEFGLDCGQFFLDYLSKLDPECEWLFAKPRRVTNDGALENIHAMKCWYERAKVGKNTVSQALPTLSTICGLPRYTNDKMRPTAIQLLKRSSFSDREIMQISGTKNIFERNDAMKQGSNFSLLQVIKWPALCSIMTQFPPQKDKPRRLLPSPEKFLKSSSLMMPLNLKPIEPRKSIPMSLNLSNLNANATRKLRMKPIAPRKSILMSLNLSNATRKFRIN